jgi:hypothetical protein
MEEIKMNTNNETARKIGQNVAIGITVVEQTVIKLAEQSREKAKTTIEKGKSFLDGLKAGFLEVRNQGKVLAAALKEVEEQKKSSEQQPQ